MARKAINFEDTRSTVATGNGDGYGYGDGYGDGYGYGDGTVSTARRRR